MTDTSYPLRRGQSFPVLAFGAQGVLHTTGGYMVYTATTFKHAFDFKREDVFWCTADCGWITGHSYIAYGPLLNGATQVLYEGVPNFPDWGRCWEIVDHHQVSIFYTAPTAIRAAMSAGNDVSRQPRAPGRPHPLESPAPPGQPHPLESPAPRPLCPCAQCMFIGARQLLYPIRVDGRLGASLLDAS